MTVLLAAAGFLALIHVTGEFLGGPVWRYAEVAALVLLLAAALLRGPRRPPPWVLPAALVVLIADAVRTVPSEPEHGLGMRFLSPEAVDVPSAFEISFGATAAMVLFLLLLMAVFRVRPPWVALVPAVLVVGYVLVRSEGLPPSGAIMPILLGLLAVGVAAGFLAKRPGPLADTANPGRKRQGGPRGPARGDRLAAAGAGLVAIAALLHLEDTRGMLPASPSSAFVTHGVYYGQVTALRPAVLAALQLAAIFLIVLGLTRGNPPQDAETR